MPDTSDAVAALLGLSGAAMLDGESADAKRKYESFTTDTSPACQLCDIRNIPDDADFNSLLSRSCLPCLQRVSLTARLLYHPEESSRKKIRSRSPVQEMYLGLHGMEAAEAAMANLGSFLTATERALFGVALDPTGHPTRASEMVTGKFVTELDFGDIDPRLAARLTDEHLKCILVNIDAEHYLEVLKLTHCVGVTGRGLEPLRDSRVLELLDLSLMKLHESPSVALSKSDISEAVVLPILDSILRRGEHSALKHIQFPQKWKKSPSNWFEDFMRRYNDFLNIDSRQLCLLCNVSSPDGFTCYLCLDYICNDCLRSSTEADPETQHVPGSYCASCEKNFCRKCVAFRQCQGDACVNYKVDKCIECTTVCTTCKVAQCSHCTCGGKCDGCGNNYCGNFGTDCLGEHCIGCDKSFCDRCIEFDYCACGAVLCSDCRFEDDCSHNFA